MKEEDYKLKFIGDDWVFLPQQEVNKKFQYDKLLYNIRRREKKIQSDLEKIKILKKELRKMKKKRTKEYHQLVKYHKKFSPSFSISMSKNKKLKQKNSTEISLYTSGNRSWDCIVSVGGKRRSIYLGTNPYVTKYLDLIEGRTNLTHWYEMKPVRRTDHYDLIKEQLIKIVTPLIRKEMIRELKMKGTLDDWINKKIDGKKYLPRLYKKSSYYEPPVKKVKKESKGFHLGFDKTGKPIYGKRKTKQQIEEERKQNKTHN
ncbi:hypothetical protein [Lentiprolixibacter aurantiacus]|uniref:Uncharacterized protein n=1 Tax=Lentiprolixibacter aurantiacus TaxID=2993939 RepID=A0AAE3ML56_9FLAO|nr:hypothetical protein [Lentiprolixibacter aurantiacus]MCX2718914.1 hypothetical protein [Lentiprolixibacter aurantiacus]